MLGMPYFGKLNVPISGTPEGIALKFGILLSYMVTKTWCRNEQIATFGSGVIQVTKFGKLAQIEKSHFCDVRVFWFRKSSTA